MSNATYEKMYNCPVECDAINYSHYTISTPFNAGEMCPVTILSDDCLMKKLYMSPMPPQLLKK